MKLFNKVFATSSKTSSLHSQQLHNDENIPLLSEEHVTSSVKCWCCWESDSTTQNPLIRVCKGCKDVDLQYIHQECIDKYITSLPVPTNRNFEDEEVESNVRDQKFYCTRCLDPYQVEHTKIHPILVLLEDPFLFVAMTLMSICVCILSACCIILLYQHWNTGHYLFQIGWFGLKMTSFSAIMLFFCHGVNIITWNMVLGHCHGKTAKHVLPLEEENQMQDDIETQTSPCETVSPSAETEREHSVLVLIHE
ncbi:hypothetical protein HK099_006618 [Clydaea vesicula]|uniref:RING-CH-type domain-containing protein n=1 Tax=Clydaea vesicula TaxID=447962 RepID=A0AAD5TXF4_9FUNG|nr:hypothetical protein HK099_006618 [Clydaea vesicula]KAJ3378098.1 hypothetical protein HDU92_007667 [Lobulomyces angularis]